MSEPFTKVPDALMASDAAARLSGKAILLYCRLLRYAGTKGAAWPSRETLAEWLHASPRQLDRYVLELVNVGLVKVRRPGMGRTNRYYLAGASTKYGDSRVDRCGDQEWTDVSTHDSTDVATLSKRQRKETTVREKRERPTAALTLAGTRNGAHHDEDDEALPFD